MWTIHVPLKFDFQFFAASCTQIWPRYGEERLIHSLLPMPLSNETQNWEEVKEQKTSRKKATPSVPSRYVKEYDTVSYFLTGHSSAVACLFTDLFGWGLCSRLSKLAALERGEAQPLSDSKRKESRDVDNLYTYIETPWHVFNYALW